LAPHLAAEAEGKRLDPQRLRRGVDYWTERSDVVLVEGAGGLLSPLGEDELVADLAIDFGYPLVIVARNALGTINHTLLTVEAAQRRRLAIAGVVLNEPLPRPNDASLQSNRRELEKRLPCEVLALGHGQDKFGCQIDWFGRAG
jgi:dethiobiotin synthetase